MLLMSNASLFRDEDQCNNPGSQSCFSQSSALIFILTSEKKTDRFSEAELHKCRRVVEFKNI